jgi:hypothetical protein
MPLQLKGPSRMVYERVWEISKFDKAFPITASSSGAVTGIIGEMIDKAAKVLKSEKFVIGSEIGSKCEW